MRQPNSNFFLDVKESFKGTLMFGISLELYHFKNWQLLLGQLYSGRDKSDCPLPCTIVATVAKSSLVHGSNETFGFELGFYPEVEVEKLSNVALILLALHFHSTCTWQYQAFYFDCFDNFNFYVICHHIHRFSETCCNI